MKRRDIISVAEPGGDYSRKPRPAVVVQSDVFNSTHASVTVCLITGYLTGYTLFRVAVPADRDTGLRKSSEVEIDKVQAVRLDRIGGLIGRVPDAIMSEVDTALKTWLSL